MTRENKLNHMSDISSQVLQVATALFGMTIAAKLASDAFGKMINRD